MNISLRIAGIALVAGLSIAAVDAASAAGLTRQNSSSVSGSAGRGFHPRQWRHEQFALARNQ